MLTAWHNFYKHAHWYEQALYLWFNYIVTIELLLYPVNVTCHFCVDPGTVGLGTATTKAGNADLVPPTVCHWLAGKWASGVTLTSVVSTEDGESCAHHFWRQIPRTYVAFTLFVRKEGNPGFAKYGIITSTCMPPTKGCTSIPIFLSLQKRWRTWWSPNNQFNKEDETQDLI